MKKQISVLGCTGSIGEQALDVIASHPDEMALFGIAANRNINAMLVQAKKYLPRVVACETEFDARTVQEPVVSGRVLFAPSFLPSLLLFLPLLVLGVFSSAQTFPQHKPPSQDVVLKRFS